MFVDTSIAYKKKHPLYLFVKSYISNVRYQMLFLTFYLFFFDVSYINCFMLLIFFQFILCTDQSFSGILSVVITILGRRYSHFLLEYFTESKGITIAAGNCNFPAAIFCLNLNAPEQKNPAASTRASEQQNSAGMNSRLQHTQQIARSQQLRIQKLDYMRSSIIRKYFTQQKELRCYRTSY